MFPTEWGNWKTLSHLRPVTREEAQKKLSALSRAMPTREFRILEIEDEDIPF